mgnify:CR=1 FL=1
MSTLLWVTSLLALENMRPQIELRLVSGGAEVILDFSNIQAYEWHELLSKPEAFFEGGYGLAGKPEDPALPSITQLIPVNAITHPEISSLSSNTNPLISTILKSTPPGRLEEDPTTIIRNFDWETSGVQLSPIAQLGQPVKMRGQTFLPLTINPIVLDVNQRQVSVIEKLVIEISGISLGNPASLDETGNIRSIIPDTDIYEQLGHYLIITPPAYENYLQHLVDWKRRKGHPVTVVNTDLAGQTPTAIKAYIQEAYDTWENQPEYVLLIGDEDRGIGGFYVYNPDMEALVTDHPYVLLDGDDSFPEAWVGRLSIDTIGQLLVVINKILHYERQPYLGDRGWFKRGLLVCTVNAAISTQHTNNWIGRKLVENGFTQVDTAYYPMQANLSYVKDPINNGVGWVNYRGLGAWDHWIGPYFYNSDIDDLQNGFKLPIMTSIVCGGGNFAAPTDPVFGEQWIRAGTSSVPKGAVAFIGPSEVHTHTQFNNVIDVALYSAIFDLGMNELGPALWYAKLDLWRNYYQSQYLPFGQSAEFYHNVYNILGDPGMNVWTDTPKTLVVDYPQTLNMSDDHVTVSVHDELGTAIPDAFVFILNRENAIGLRTDASGIATLAFIPGLDSTLELTVTGKNLDPVLETISISATSDLLSYSSWEINADDFLEAGGTHSMNLSIDNNGGDINDLTFTLKSRNSCLNITDSVYVMDTFEAGSSIQLNDLFSLEVDRDVDHGDLVELTIEIVSDTETWIWKRNLPVQAAELKIKNMRILDGELQAGNSVNVRLSIENIGGIASSLMTLIFQPDPMINCLPPSLSYQSIEADETIHIVQSLALDFSDQLYPGEIVTLRFACETAGRVDTLEYELTIGQLNRFAPSLPDAYGYRVFDDADVSYSLVPVYDWLEIDPTLDGSGTRLSISDNDEEEDDVVQMDLPFTVTYYGQTYDAVTICSNGWLALGYSPEVSFNNRVIPSPAGPNAMIAPFWDDLITNPGGVNYLELDDRIIIEWSRMSNLDVPSTLNFQVIIYDTLVYPTRTGDNIIKMQFKDYYNYDTWTSFSTTGIESPDFTTGQQVSYNNSVEISVGELHSEQAILFTTERAERLPAPEMSISDYSLNFILNPWSQASDSIAITNNGGSPLVFNVGPADEPDLQVALNPLAGYDFVKGGSEPDGSTYQPDLRDVFDYVWLDQDDVGGPEFNWIDISQPSNAQSYDFDPDDSSIGPFEIGFDFPFFSEMYSEFYFSSNGTMSFVSPEYPWTNLTLPNGAAPPALIAPWWDDLNNNDGVQGVPYIWTNGIDTTVICWDNFPKFSTDERHTFEVLLISNGDILLQYLEMEGTSSSSTVGIQNATKTKGLQVTYNTSNSISDGTAILIQRQNSWLKVNAWSGRVAAGETRYFRADVDTRGLGQDAFALPFMLRSNSSNHPEIPISIHLSVVYGELPYGDINSDYQVNIHDVTTLIEFAVQLIPPDASQIERGDFDENGRLDVRDAVQLVQFILSE